MAMNNNLLPDSPWPLVRIDGDLYVPSLPSRHLRRDLLYQKRLPLQENYHDLPILYLKMPNGHGDRHRQVCIGGASAPLSNGCLSWREPDKGSNWKADIADIHMRTVNDSLRHGLLQLVLVPLNANGQPDLTLALNNPDGCVVEGGSMSVDKNHLIISDTNDEPLRWMWWHGLLVNIGPFPIIEPFVTFVSGLCTDILYFLY